MSEVSVELRQISWTPELQTLDAQVPEVQPGIWMWGFRWPGQGLSAGHSPGGGAGCPAVAH